MAAGLLAVITAVPKVANPAARSTFVRCLLLLSYHVLLLPDCKDQQLIVILKPTSLGSGALAAQFVHLYCSYVCKTNLIDCACLYIVSTGYVVFDAVTTDIESRY